MRRIGEEIANTGATHKDIRNAPQVQASANDQIPMNPMTNGEVREDLFQMAQAITTQSQAITAQANREVVP